jgi:CARDB/Fibronectin type III domain
VNATRKSRRGLGSPAVGAVAQLILVTALSVTCGDNSVEPAKVGVIALSPVTVSFAGSAGGESPPAQHVQVTNAGDGPLTGLTASVAYAAGQPTGWLSATLSSAAAPGVLTLAAATGALPAGSYAATVSVASPVADNGPVTVSVTFTVTGVADLVISEPATLTVSPSTVAAGGAVALPAWAVRNDGTATSNPVRAGVYLSTDATITASDLQLRLVFISNPLEPGGGRGALAETLTIPGTTVPGSYYIGVLADVTNETPESDEENNFKSAALTVTAAPAIALSSTSLTIAATVAGPNPAAQTVDVENGGGGTLGGLAVGPIAYGAGQPEGWLAAALDGPTTPATLTLQATIGTLPAGTYSAVVPVTSPVAANSPVAVSVTFTVAAPVLADLVVTGRDGGQLTVTPTTVAPGGTTTLSGWTVRNDGAAPSGDFGGAIYLSTDTTITAGDVQLIWFPNSVLPPGGSESYATYPLIVPVNTAPGSYYVGLLVDVGEGTPESNENNNFVSTPLTVVAPLPDLTVSGADGAPFTVTPTSVAQGGTVSISAFTLANVGAVASGSFTVGLYLSSDPVLTPDDVRMTEDVHPGLAAGASEVYPGGSLPIPSSTPVGSYYVGFLVDYTAVIAESNEGNNAVSAALTVTQGLVPPAAPSGLVATVVDGTTVDLRWTDNSSSEDGFGIERCGGGLSICYDILGSPAVFTQIATVFRNVTTFANTGLTTGATYYYRVRAYNAYGASAASNTVFATPNVPTPTNLTATATSSSQVHLAWTDNASDATSTQVWRCAGAGCTTFAQIATLGAGVTSFDDGGLGETTAYSYRVRVVASSGTSPYSNTATVTTLPATAAPAAPSALVATVVSGNQINLGWTDNAANETGFKIERCTGGTCTAFAEVATVGASMTSYQSLQLIGGTTYRYRVLAYNSVGVSAYSDIVAATTLPVPATPSGLAATPVSSGQLNLTWTDNATNETGFRIESCDGATCTDFTQLVAVGANATSYQNTAIYSSTTYRYRVYAYNGNGNSAYSGIASATTPALEAPTGLVATVNSSARIILTWTNHAPDWATSHVEIQRCAGVACTNFARITDVDGAVSTYVNTGLTPATSYSYRVRATRNSASSAFSNTVTAATPAVPAAPSGLGATVVSSSQINLSWTDNASTETQYRIERCAGTGCTNFAQIASVGANVTTYQNTGLVSLTTYSYRVRAWDGDNHSAYGNVVAAATPPAPGSPAAPSNLVATPVSAGEIDLQWTDNATNETGYQLERCAGAGCTNFAAIATASVPNVTSYQNTGLTSATTYSYRVRMFNAAGNSLYSNTATATTP